MGQMCNFPAKFDACLSRPLAFLVEIWVNHLGLVAAFFLQGVGFAEDFAPSCCRRLNCANFGCKAIPIFAAAGKFNVSWKFEDDWSRRFATHLNAQL